MKKSLFGYNIAETDTILEALREENKSLNKIIATLKAQIEKNGSDYHELSPEKKVIHKIKTKSNQPPQPATHKKNSINRICGSATNLETQKKAKIGMTAKIRRLQGENEDLQNKILEQGKQVQELEKQNRFLYDRIKNRGKVNLDLKLDGLEKAMHNTSVGLQALIDIFEETQIV